MRFARLLLALLIVACCAFASPILTLHNTGLATPGTADPYWTVNGGTAFVTNNAFFPFPPWLADSGVSAWISPQPAYNGPTDAPGTYAYVTNFDLTGLNPATATISFRWAVDNAISDVLLNGVSIGHTFATPSDFNFQADVVNMTSGFVSGVNTLEFVTQNLAGFAGNPDGLRVEFSSDASSASAIPEPATLMLIGGGFIALALIRRRRA